MSHVYQLIWFRQDLRIHDHAALWHAAQTGSCIAIVLLSPEQWQRHDDAPIKIEFYLRQLQELKKQLDSLNIPLIVQTIPLWNDIPQFFIRLLEHINFQNIYANIEVGVNELQRDANVQKLLNQHQKELVLLHDRTLFPFASIRNQSNLPYQVFGAFKKACYQRLQHALPQCYPVPNIQQPIKLDLSALAQTDIYQLQVEYAEKIKPPMTALWNVGESHAHNLLDHFIDQNLTDYKVSRDLPSISGTSQLSTYLNIGILSIRQCIQALF
ncbi:MAG: deoxyribodipyrimidine photo-lyase, partial [Acinetobacter sp.]|uniref:deoxyribodipyrimidine photo-lyase n=1 Tax=Acinetobacter sp. TaxID=472 RepID=UPI0025866F18